MKPIMILATIAALGACNAEYQTTSGATYLADANIEDPELRRAAAYEPNLQFPARIGVVKLVYNRITSIPKSERDLFAEAIALVPGEVVQLGALEEYMMPSQDRRHSFQDRIRALAVSRHLEYLLIISYDPTLNTAEALFMDVRNGYPHANIEFAALRRGKTNFWGGHLRNQNRINAATLTLARGLAPKVKTMLEGLLDRAS